MPVFLEVIPWLVDSLFLYPYICLQCVYFVYAYLHTYLHFALFVNLFANTTLKFVYMAKA